MNAQQIGSNIRALRREHHLTLRELGERAGVSFGYLDDLELHNSNARNPSEDEIQRIAYVLGVSVEGLQSKKVPKPHPRKSGR